MRVIAGAIQNEAVDGRVCDAIHHVAQAALPKQCQGLSLTGGRRGNPFSTTSSCLILASKYIFDVTLELKMPWLAYDGCLKDVAIVQSRVGLPH